jgi:RND superfamily putative drug exporter
MFKKLSTLVIKYPWYFILGWVVFAAAVMLTAPKLIDYTSSSSGAGLSSSYQSVQASNTASKYFPTATDGSGSLAISNTDGQVLSTANQQTAAGLVTDLNSKKIDGVLSITSSPAYLSTNQKVQLVQIIFNGPAGDATVSNAVTAVRNETNSYLSGSGLQGQLTGSASISLDTTNAYSSAQTIITIATVGAIILLLLIVFRSPIIAILPVIVIGILHVVATGLTAFLAKGMNFVVGTDLDPLLVVLMFGVGTDYIVFLLFRYRDDIIDAAPKDKVGLHKVLEKSLSKMSLVIVSAAATVITAFAALLIAKLESLQTLAPGLIIGVFIMAVAGITLIPAIFKLLGKALFWPTHIHAPKPGKWSQSAFMSKIVGRRPLVTVIVVVVLMAGLSLGMFNFSATYNTLAELPGDTLSLQAYNTLATSFPEGVLGPTQVFVSSNSGSALNAADVNNLAAKLKAINGVASVGAPTYSTGNQAALISVVLSSNPYSTTAMSLVQNTIEPAANSSISGATVSVGGTTSNLVDVKSALKTSLNQVIPLALIIVGIILAFLLRAVVAPLYILLGVALLYTAVLGSLCLVFLNLLNYPGLDFSIPLICYLFVMAVGSDYNILIADLIKSEHNEGVGKLEAAKNGILRGMPSVSAAGAILTATFASLLFTNIQVLEEIGMAVMVAVIIAAFFLTTKAMPGVAILQGKYYWWPAHKMSDHANALATATGTKATKKTSKKK